MQIPNTTTEPLVAGDVAKANEQVANSEPAKVLQSDEILKEFQPVEVKPQVSDEQRNKDRDVREAKFNLQLTAHLKQVEKAIADGTDIEDALANVPQHLQGKIRKIALSEEVGEPQDYDSKITEAVNKARSIDKAQSTILEAINNNGLNLATAEAKERRTQLLNEYNRLLKSNSPQEAAEFALFKSGLANKQAVDDAYNSGYKQANMGVPPPGYTGRNSYTAQPNQELTPEQIAAMPFEKLEAYDAQFRQNMVNSAPMTSVNSLQGNPNIR